MLELSLLTSRGFDTGTPLQDNGVFLSTCKTRYNHAHIGAIFSIIRSLLDTQDVFVQIPGNAPLNSKISKAEVRVAEAKSGGLIPVTMKDHVAVATSKKVLSVSREELGLRRLVQQRESIEAMKTDIELLKDDIRLMDDDIDAKKKDLKGIRKRIDDDDPSDGAGRLQETIKKLEEDEATRMGQVTMLQDLKDRLKSDREAVGLFELIKSIYFSTQTADRIKRAIDTSLDTKVLEEYEDEDLDFDPKGPRADTELGIDTNTLNEYENYFRDCKHKESHQGIDIETLENDENCHGGPKHRSQTCRSKKKTMAVEAPPADEQKPPLKREAPPADEQQPPLEHWIIQGGILCEDISSMEYFIGKER